MGACAGATSPGPAGHPPPGARDGGDAGSNFDWNFTTSAPVNATPALWIANYPNSSATDAIYFGTDTTAGPNFFKLTNIYQASPTVAWSATTAGGLHRGAVTLSRDGSKVYALDRMGNLYCFAAASGGRCAGWATQSTGTGQPVNGTGPWLDYGSNSIYVASGSFIFKFDAGTGNEPWAFNVSANLSSSPLAFGGFVYFGSDTGRFHRLHDPGATPPAPSDLSTWVLCPSLPCAPAWQVAAGPSGDVATGHVYIAANGTVFEFPLGTATWAPSAQLSLNDAGVVVASSPMLDRTNGQLYVGYESQLYQMPYPLVAGSFPLGTFLYGQGSSNPSPIGSPLVYNGAVYTGDGAGYAEKYECMSRGLGPQLSAVTTQYGLTVDTTPVVDFANGNIVFGYATSGGTGGLVQITQAGGWGCGTLQNCTPAGCGGNACKPALACVPAGIPPDVIWVSAGGGTGSAGGFVLDLSFGVGNLGPPVSTGNETFFLGSFASETF
jgi:hypothetical protein